MKLAVNDLLGIAHVRTHKFDALKFKNVSGISTDTRTVRRGEVFVALRGETLDGHRFLKAAIKSGAACVIVDEECKRTLYKDHPAIVVPDTTKALGQLANVYRKKFQIPFIAVAGSNGKTTTKEMITAVLKTTYNVLSTQGNLNNHIGVPQTLFRLNRKHDVAVVEIGTNHFGELRYLCGILEPTHGVITNIGHEHLEFFRDLNGVAKAEGELFSALRANKTGFVNADDARVVKQSKHLRKKVTYGFSGKSISTSGTFKNVNPKGCVTFTVKPRQKKAFDVELSVPGNHAMMNALAAAAVGVEFKIPAAKIQKSLKQFRAVSKRMEVTKAGGVTILNDTYNANTDSVLSALDTLKLMKCKGRKIVVLADMLELGSSSQREHANIGKAVTNKDYDYLLSYGTMAKHIYHNASVKVRVWFEGKNVLCTYLAELVSPGDIVLVKGSRGMKMEEVVQFLRGHLQSHPSARR